LRSSDKKEVGAGIPKAFAPTFHLPLKRKGICTDAVSDLGGLFVQRQRLHGLNIPIAANASLNLITDGC
jgi:hypothetical protein